MTLPDDFARCIGVGYVRHDALIDWRDGCERCLRRLSPPGERSTWIEPPEVIAFECEYLVEDA